MRAAWIHDHYFYEDSQGEIYSTSGVDYKALERYLPFCDTLLVTGRKKSVEKKDTNNLVSCNGKNVEFRLNENFQNPLEYFIKKEHVNQPLKELINSVDYCIILLPSLLGIMAIDECKKMNKPYIIQIIGCAWDALFNHGSYAGKLAAPIIFNDTKKRVRDAPYVMYITNSFLQKRYPTKGRMGSGIANVNVHIFEEEVIKNREEKIKNFKENEELKIGLIGSLDVSYKGHDTAIKALKIVSKSYPNIKLHFLGKGNKKRWEKMAEKHGVADKVIFEGSLPSGEPVWNWLDSLDFYIQPSTAEGHGRSVVEAMSRGCPVISSDVGGLSDSVKKEFQFKAKDSKQLAKLLFQLINHNKQLLDMSRENFELSKNYDNKIIEQKRKDFFEVFLKSQNLI